MIEKAVRTVLLACSDVTDLINNKVYPLIIPQRETLPAVTYKRITTTPIHTMVEEYDVEKVMLLIRVDSLFYEEMKDISKAIKDCFLNYKGTVGDTYIQAALFENQHDDVTENKESVVYYEELEFTFWYSYI